jgi:hypothetical protein
LLVSHDYCFVCFLEADLVKQFTVKSKPSPRTYSSGNLSGSGHGNSNNNIHSKRGVSASAILSGPPLAMVANASTNLINGQPSNAWLGSSSSSNNNNVNNNGSYFNSQGSFSPSRQSHSHMDSDNASPVVRRAAAAAAAGRGGRGGAGEEHDRARFSGPPLSKEMFK